MTEIDKILLMAIPKNLIDKVVRDLVDCPDLTNTEKDLCT